MDIHDHYLLRITVMSIGPMLTYKFVNALYQPMVRSKKCNDLTIEDGHIEAYENESKGSYESDDDSFFDLQSENGQPTYKCQTRV